MAGELVGILAVVVGMFLGGAYIYVLLVQRKERWVLHLPSGELSEERDKVLFQRYPGPAKLCIKERHDILPKV